MQMFFATNEMRIDYNRFTPAKELLAKPVNLAASGLNLARMGLLKSFFFELQVNLVFSLQIVSLELLFVNPLFNISETDFI